jgi:electron transport complex protein RnfA
MRDLLALLTGAMLVNNIVLTQCLGLYPLLGSSGRVGTAVAMALTTSAVLLLAAVGCSLLETLVLAPLDLTVLRIPCQVLVIAVSVGCTERQVRQRWPLQHAQLGWLLPLATANCAILGVTVLNGQLGRDPLESLIVGLGTALGFSLVLILFAALQERLTVSDVPAPFRGAAITLITAGLASLAFMGFAGLG